MGIAHLFKLNFPSLDMIDILAMSFAEFHALGRPERVGLEARLDTALARLAHRTTIYEDGAVPSLTSPPRSRRDSE